MTTINDKIKACDYVLANILDEQERIIYQNEAKIIQMNTSQFEEGQGSDGKDLFNKDETFTGIYKNVPGQTKSGLYDFNVTGNFLRGLQVEVLPSLTQISIFSTGTGSGDKSIFFAGYTNLYGLNQKNNRILQYEIILPQLTRWIKRYL